MQATTEYDILDLSELSNTLSERDLSIQCTCDSSVEIAGETDTLLLSAEANDILMDRSAQSLLLVKSDH